MVKLKGTENIKNRLKTAGKTLFERLRYALRLYGENALTNHAAACAFGFLLSVTPMLLLMVFIALIIIRQSPGTLTAFFGTLPQISNVVEQWVSNDVFRLSAPGLTGIITVVSILWTSGIFAFCIQRGINVVFSAYNERSLFKKFIVTAAIELSVIIFVLVAIISSRAAQFIYSLLPAVPLLKAITSIVGRAFSHALLGLIAFLVYLFVPVVTPRKTACFWGAFCCIFAYSCTVLVFDLILDRARFNFIYGTMGNLVVMLINVFMFFIFFFYGAQMTDVLDKSYKAR